MALLPYRIGYRFGAEQPLNHVGHQQGDLDDVHERDIRPSAIGIHAWFLQGLSAAQEFLVDLTDLVQDLSHKAVIGQILLYLVEILLRYVVHLRPLPGPADR